MVIFIRLQVNSTRPTTVCVVSSVLVLVVYILITYIPAIDIFYSWYKFHPLDRGLYDFPTLWEVPRSSVGAGKSGCVGNVLKKYHLHRCHRPPTLHLHHDQLRIGCLVGFSSYGGFKILLTSYANHLFVRKGCRLYILTWVRNFINEISV